MNEDRLGSLMRDAVADVEASDTLRAKLSALAAATDRSRRRRSMTRGWIAVGERVSLLPPC